MIGSVIPLLRRLSRAPEERAWVLLGAYTDRMGTSGKAPATEAC